MKLHKNISLPTPEERGGFTRYMFTIFYRKTKSTNAIAKQLAVILPPKYVVGGEERNVVVLFDVARAAEKERKRGRYYDWGVL